MAINPWWAGDAAERFWLENTDRDDLGANLKAPILDDSGKENWRYTLLREMEPGDVVFHYYKPDHAIVARSVVAAKARSE